MNWNEPNRHIVARFYNDILFDGDRIIKGVSQDRFVKETEWFKEAKKRIPNNIPRIYHNGRVSNYPNNKNLKYYEMERIDGNNLYQWVLHNKELAPNAFDELIKLVKSMHSESYSISAEDIYQMYYLKPKTSLEDFISKKKIDLDSLIINGYGIKNIISTLKSVFGQLEEKLFNTRYSFIHGDLTMSNTLLDREGRLYLVDPRGDFGNTKVFGDVRYDIAKLYFSIIGNFDSLNNGQFNYQPDKLKMNTHTYSIVDNGFHSYGEKLLKEFQEDSEVIKFIHATIWLSLLPHIADDLNQQFCAFCNGAYLLNLLN